MGGSVGERGVVGSYLSSLGGHLPAGFEMPAVGEESYSGGIEVCGLDTDCGVLCGFPDEGDALVRVLEVTSSNGGSACCKDRCSDDDNFFHV